MTPDTPTQAALPPLPEPAIEDHPAELWGQNVLHDLFTADQMRAYAQQALQEACAERDALRAQVEWLSKAADKLLAHCPDAECGTCAKAMCPFGDGFHYHHDGCPSCSAITGDRKEGA